LNRGRQSALIIGAGVIGLFVAYFLSSGGMDVTVVEKETKFGMGVTSGQAGVIHVVQLPFGSKKSRLARRGNRLYDELRDVLGVKILRVPAILVVTSFIQIPSLPFVYLYLWLNLRKDFSVKMVRRRSIVGIEPSLSKCVRAGIVIDRYGTIDVESLLSGLERKLKINGALLQYGTTACGAERKDRWILYTDHGEFTGDWIVNAAGLYADDVATMLGKDFGRLEPGMGVMEVYSGMELKAVVAPLALEYGSRTKGGAIIPTPDGSVIVGPNLRMASSKEDRNFGPEDIQQLESKFHHLIDRWGKLERVYTGVRPLSPTKDFIIDIDHKMKVVNLVGIESPGLTAAPAIGELVANQICEKDEGVQREVLTT
jgi:glycerol-3-phosphate dehydrogenase